MSIHDEKRQHSVAKNVMQQIESGSVKMRPHWRFFLVLTLYTSGIITAAVLTVYLTNLVVYKLRLASSNHPMFGLRTNIGYDASHLPWLACILGLFSIALLLWLIRKFDFSYHFGRWLLVVVVAVGLAVGTAVAFTNLNDHLKTFGPMRDFYGPPMQEGQGHGKSRNVPQTNNGHEGPSGQNSNGMVQHRGQ